MSVTIGTLFGPYAIESLLGSGGMGEVYKARDTRLGRAVAIKVLSPQLSEKPELRQRFEREARAIAALEHPHICTLYDVGQQDGVWFLVMEYLDGETLAARLKRRPLRLNDVLGYGAEIADALGRAHRLGIVHRDVKPANVMLTKTGTKLLDFGVVKLDASSQRLSGAPDISSVATESEPELLTAAGGTLGTLPYMSPEQLEAGS